MTAVNGVITFAGVPSLPFGGVGDSGFGRIHGPDGLKEFTYAKAIARQRFKPLLALTSFSRTEKMDTQLATMITMLHGRGTTIPKREIVPLAPSTAPPRPRAQTPAGSDDSEARPSTRRTRRPHQVKCHVDRRYQARSRDRPLASQPPQTANVQPAAITSADVGAVVLAKP